MSAELLSQVFLPISLIIIMIGMGMSLEVKDFTQIVKFPKAAIIGLTNQLILLPILGFLLALAFNLGPVMAIGLMALALAPGGVTSNLVSQVCKGNIALSVSLTAVCSFVGLISIPLVLSFCLDYFGTEAGVPIKLPVGKTILQIMVITVIPISLGMLVRKFKLDFCNRMEKPMKTASTIIFIIVFISVIAANYELLSKGFKLVGLATLALNLISMGIGYLSAKAFKLNFRDSITISIESGIQNGTLSFVIVTTILNNIEMGIPTAVYAIWMFASAGFLMWQLNRSKKPGTIKAV